MAFTDENIETILNAYEGKYGVEITKEDRHMYVGFLQRQGEAHPETDISKEMFTNRQEYRKTTSGRISRKKPVLPYLELMVMKTYLFDILMERMTVRTDKSIKKMILKNRDLIAIRARTAEVIPDESVGWIMRRMTDLRKHFIYDADLPTYKDMLLELIQDEAVIKKRGKLTYTRDFSVDSVFRTSRPYRSPGSHPLSYARDGTSVPKIYERRRGLT
ncbi:MAG: hypothetical protein ABIH34_01030 [Nanoarchaeota archaeon]